LRDSQKWRKREFAVFDRVDKVYYPSAVEVDEILKGRPDLDARAIPLYVLPETEALPYEIGSTQDILFVGGFNHPPNVDGICWFVEEVLPLVSAARPDIRLHVVGSNPTDAVEALQSERVTVYGYLSDEELDALYRRVRQVVVPLRFGAGVKGKVLEAVQKNRPVVTTSVGAEGIPVAASVMNIADTAADFAALVQRVDEGNADCLARMDGYAGWLQQYFGKAHAAAIIEEDFGSPLRDSAGGGYRGVGDVYAEAR
jgi:glycosyltransferase involved in cell wall biosynthesis